MLTDDVLPFLVPLGRKLVPAASQSQLVPGGLRPELMRFGGSVQQCLPDMQITRNKLCREVPLLPTEHGDSAHQPS